MMVSREGTECTPLPNCCVVGVGCYNILVFDRAITKDISLSGSSFVSKTSYFQKFFCFPYSFNEGCPFSF